MVQIRSGSRVTLRAISVLTWAGEPREFLARVRAQISRRPSPDIRVGSDEGGFPEIEAGRLRVDGFWHEPGTAAIMRRCWGALRLPAALSKARGRPGARMPGDAPDLRRVCNGSSCARPAGSREHRRYAHICRYLARWAIYRDSPVARPFTPSGILPATAITTGFGNMGWAFPLADGIEPAGSCPVLRPADWLPGDRLLQYMTTTVTRLAPTATCAMFWGGSSARVAASGPPAGSVRADFWQNYPAEVEFQMAPSWFPQLAVNGKPTPPRLRPS